MNVYDFDKTIYRNDSTVDFYFYSIKRHPSVLLFLPSLIWTALLWLFGITDKKGFKEVFYRFLSKIPDIDKELEMFWDKNQYKIKKFYKENQKEDDVVISASPEFLLEPICKRLGINHLYASVVDKKTGKYTGENCWGEEKPKRFYKAFPEGRIEEFYSDSLSDTPLALISEKSYIVEDEKLTEWDKYMPKKSIFSHFKSREFLLFIIVGCINTFNGVLFSLLWSLVIENANLAFTAGYITSLIIAYILNCFMIFKEKLNFMDLIKFAISYIPNFLIQNAIVFLFCGILYWDKAIAYIIAAVVGVPITFLCVKLFAFRK